MQNNDDNNNKNDADISIEIAIGTVMYRTMIVIRANSQCVNVNRNVIICHSLQ